MVRPAAIGGSSERDRVVPAWVIRVLGTMPGMMISLVLLVDQCPDVAPIRGKWGGDPAAVLVMAGVRIPKGAHRLVTVAVEATQARPLHLKIVVMGEQDPDVASCVSERTHRQVRLLRGSACVSTPVEDDLRPTSSANRGTGECGASMWKKPSSHGKPKNDAGDGDCAPMRDCHSADPGSLQQTTEHPIGIEMLFGKHPGGRGLCRVITCDFLCGGSCLRQSREDE